jgi:hypothetical protein
MEKRNAVITAFYEQIQQNGYVFDDDRIGSVLEALYVVYADSQGSDSEEIRQGFADLENYLCKLSLEENNEIYALVCMLCTHYEERAFRDGLQLGAQLILELQDK